MRITNEIRNYVNKKIERRFKDIVAPYEQQLADERENCQAFLLELKRDVTNKLHEKYQCDIASDQVDLRITVPGQYRYMEFTPPDMKTIMDKISDIRSHMNEMIEDILLEISLKGAKADIEALIDKQFTEGVQ